MIGFWGYPEPAVLEEYKKKYPSAIWLDLDLDFNHPDTKILPDAYCKIIKNIVNNSLFYKDKLHTILAPIGKDKCDSGWFASVLLKDLGFNIVQTKFEETSEKSPLKISTSNLPLKKKIELITGQIIDDVNIANIEATQCGATFGFWGVPPNDLSILEMFPDTTHVFGWSRCVEAKVPADIELEMYVDENVPTVFYSQSFCAKAQLARYLADKYNGLFVDIDDVATNSTRAKIEAFLRLR